LACIHINNALAQLSASRSIFSGRLKKGHGCERVRYRGVAKNQFAAFLQAMTFNLKRLVVIEADLVAA